MNQAISGRASFDVPALFPHVRKLRIADLAPHTAAIAPFQTYLSLSFAAPAQPALMPPVLVTRGPGRYRLVGHFASRLAFHLREDIPALLLPDLSDDEVALLGWSEVARLPSQQLAARSGHARFRQAVRDMPTSLREMLFETSSDRGLARLLGVSPSRLILKRTF